MVEHAAWVYSTLAISRCVISLGSHLFVDRHVFLGFSFDYRLCLFDKVEQYFHRPDRAQKALAAFQRLSPAERESLKLDVSSFTGGPADEQVFLLGKFKSLDAVNCPREDKAGKLGQEKGVKGETGGGRGTTQGDSRKKQKQAKERAVKGKDEETSAAEGVAGISVRPEEEKKDEKEKEEEQDEEDEGDEDDGDDDESLVTPRPRYCFEMSFVDGTSCAPGLARETRVLIYCGSELAVLEVSKMFSPGFLGDAAGFVCICFLISGTHSM